MKRFFRFNKTFKHKQGGLAVGQVVSRGLVLHLDAANPASNTGSGNFWYDLSGNGHNLYMNNPTRNSDFGGAIRLYQGGGGLDWGGGSGYASFGVIPRVRTANEISLCAWCKCTGFTSYIGGFQWAPIFSIDQYDRGSAYVKFTVSFDWSNGTFGLGGNNAGNGAGTANATSQLAYSAFNRVAYIVWSCGTSATKLYVDGQLVNTGPGGSMNTNAIGNFQLGGRVSGGQPFYPGQFPGLFYQAQVYDKQLTDAEVLENYNANKTRFGL